MMEALITLAFPPVNRTNPPKPRMIPSLSHPKGILKIFEKNKRMIKTYPTWRPDTART